MSNTDRDSMLERWADGMETLEQYYEGIYGPPATPPSLPPITTRDAMLEAIADGMERAKRNINKKSPTYHSDSVAYVKTVPAGNVHSASLEQIGGKTVVWNQLVDVGTTTVSTISGRKYYTLINGTASIVTSDGTAISVVDDTADMVCDLTLMFGGGNEPATTEAFAEIFPASHYPYNEGTLLSAGVTEVVSKDPNNTTIDTYPIPAEVQALEGYGYGAGSIGNYIDYERKKFVKVVEKVNLGSLAWQKDATRKRIYTTSLANTMKNFDDNTSANIVCSRFATVPAVDTYWNAVIGISGGSTASVAIGAGTNVSSELDMLISSLNGIYLYYELATPVETDISQYLTDNLIEVEAGGALTFPNQNGDDYRIPVPSSETFVVGEP